MSSNIVSRMREWYDWLTGHVPGAVRDTVASAYNTMAERVTRLLYGENNVWHDARDDTGQQGEVEETFHDARDQEEEIQVTEAINRNVTNWEISGNDQRDR